MPFIGKSIDAPHVLFGGYELADSQKNMLNNAQQINLNDDQILRVQKSTGELMTRLNYYGFKKEGNFIIARVNNKLEGGMAGSQRGVDRQ